MGSCLRLSKRPGAFNKSPPPSVCEWLGSGNTDHCSGLEAYFKALFSLTGKSQVVAHLFFFFFKAFLPRNQVS